MRLGLERLLESPTTWGVRGKIGLLCNPTAVDHQFRHAVDLMHAHPDIDLTVLFGPEHGVRGAAQDMQSVTHRIDRATGLREVSLYGNTFASLSPTPDELSAIDVLVFDIQDIGTRYYTYATTLALCMRVAARTGTHVIVCDRPNPLNGIDVEGGGLAPGLENFCGLHAVPQRHGLTVGELARLYNEAFAIHCKLTIVPMEGWRRDQYLDATDAPWVLPSPNMPTLDTAIVYPGMCLIEATNLSEGRGTTRPFELVGAPWVDGAVLARRLAAYALAGVRFRPCVFQPTFHKHAGKPCGGVQLHVTDRRAFRPYQTGLAVLHALKAICPDDFAWRTEPYEFRSDVPAIDLLTGMPEVRVGIDAGTDFTSVCAAALQGAEAYWNGRDAALFYR